MCVLSSFVLDFVHCFHRVIMNPNTWSTVFFFCWPFNEIRFFVALFFSFVCHSLFPGYSSTVKTVPFQDLLCANVLHELGHESIKKSESQKKEMSKFIEENDNGDVKNEYI